MKSESEILNDLARYCSQAERCLFDLRKKIQSANLSGDAEKRIINKLVKEKFVDEKRFAHSFVHDKFQLNHWGRIKIVYELKQRGIPSEIYHAAMESIDETEYLAVLHAMLINKKRSIKNHPPRDSYQKLFRFAASKGFESSCISEILKKIL